MRLSRAKTGDARGRPTCESSLLGVPDTKFFCGKPAWKKIRLRHEESNQFRKHRLLWVWAGKAALPLRPHPGSLFRAREHEFELEQ